MSTQPANQPEFAVTTWAEVEKIVANNGTMGRLAYRVILQLRDAAPGTALGVQVTARDRNALQKRLHTYNSRFNDSHQRQLQTKGIGDVLYVSYIEKLQ